MNLIYTKNLNFDLQKMIQRDTKLIDKIILHHSAGKGTLMDVHKIHQARGFAGIGYHYYVRRNGDVYVGRPVNYVGSHCKKHNQYSVGVCFEGDFTVTEPTDKQLQAGYELINNILLCDYPHAKVYNHYELGQTLCPGCDLVTRLISENMEM